MLPHIALFLSASIIFACSVVFGGDSKEGSRFFEEGESIYLEAQTSADLTKAAQKFERALREFERLDDKKGICKATNNLGLIYKHWGEYKKSLDYLKRTHELCGRINDPECQAQALNNLAQAYSDLGSEEEALYNAEQSLQIRREIRDDQGVALSSHGMGYVHYNLGNYPEALKWFNISLEMYLTLEEIRGEALVLNDLGDVQTKLGLYREALQSLERSRENLRKFNSPTDEAAVISNLGVVYENIGKFDEAEKYYFEALKITKLMEEPLAQGECLINLGNVNRQLDRRDRSLEYYRECLAVYKSIGAPVNRPNDLIGNLLLDLGRLAEAEPFLIDGGNKASLARLYLINRDYEKALDFYEKQISANSGNQDAEDLFQIYTGIATVYEAIGRFPEASRFYLKAIEASEAMRSSLKPEQRANFFDVKVNGWLCTQPYEGYARVLIKMSKKEEAFKQSEFTKARVFAETLSIRSKGFETDVPLDVRRKDEELHDRLAVLLKKIKEAREKGHIEVVGALETQLKRTNEAIESHVGNLREQYPLFAATKYPQPMSLQQTNLKDGEWVLAYDVTDEGLLVYLICGKKIVKTRLTQCKRTDLEKLVQTLRRPLEFKPCDANLDPISQLKSFDLSCGKQLSDLLLEGIINHIPEKVPVLIIPDECLGLIPFEMLPLNNDGRICNDRELPTIVDAQFFGDRNPVGYYYSVTALSMVKNVPSKKDSGDRFLVIADPVYSMGDDRIDHKKMSDRLKRTVSILPIDLIKSAWLSFMGGCEFTRLSETGRLATKLELLFQNKTDSYTGLRASKENFFQQIAPFLYRYDKIVFATHGYFGKNLPGVGEPTLVLSLAPEAVDGFLTMSEIMGSVRTNANIVALTACQTGLGKQVSGEGVLGMGRAFQYGGAKSLLVSLWSVDEEASVEFVRIFFENIYNGKTNINALTFARQQIRNKGYDHPFFWAAFILVGDVN